MKKEFARLIFLSGLIIVSVSSCVPEKRPDDGAETNVVATQVYEQPTCQSSLIYQNTIEPTLSATIHPSATPTPIPLMGYSDLPDDEYILYYRGSAVEIISLDTKIQKTLVSISKTEIPLTTDNVNLLFAFLQGLNPLLINLETLKKEELPFLKGCYDITLSPDRQLFLATCVPDKRSIEVYLFSGDGKQNVRLTNCRSDEGYCGGAKFSPNGDWISYNWAPAGAIQSSKIGLYILKTACLNFTLGRYCEAKGPFTIGGEYVWSRNSEYMASTWGHGIAIFKLLEGGEITKIREIPGSEPPYYWDQVVWSVDSSQLALLKGNELWLVNASGGKSQYITTFNEPVWLIGWVKIKDGKVLP